MLGRVRSVLVHPTAVVEEGVYLGKNVVVGPYCIVGSGVRIGDNTKLRSHVVVNGMTDIGENCDFHPYSVVGGPPQDRKFDESKQEAALRIGANVVVREYVTINGGANNATTIGDNTLLLTASHVGHDCVIGNGVVISNQVQLAGHICVGHAATIGGGCTVRQFVNVGALSMLGGASAIDKHVLPYSLVQGNRAKLLGSNLVGLRRRKIPIETIRKIKSTFHSLGHDESSTLGATLEKRAETLLSQTTSHDQMIQDILHFALGIPSPNTVYEWNPKRKKIGLVL